MALNDVSANGRSPLQSDLAERRLWTWESTVRGLSLSALLADDPNAEATRQALGLTLASAGLRTWSQKEREQRGTFGYAHLAERLGYRSPVTILEKLKGVRLALNEERHLGIPSPQPLPAVLPLHADDSVTDGMARLELASRFPWRTKELFGWTDVELLDDAAEKLDFRGVDFSSRERVTQTIVDPINREIPSETEGPARRASPKSAYWLRLTRDQGHEANPPVRHISLLEDTADFGANHFLRLLYLFGPAPTGLSGRENPVAVARLKRRTFDELRFARAMLAQLTENRQDVPPQELAGYQARVAKYLERLKDPSKADPRLSTAVAEVLKQGLLRFKYWLDEPFRCTNEKLRKARQQAGIDVKAEMTFWSENHNVLYATAEYLAGQLWPNELFVPGKDFQDGIPVGAMTGEQRMRRAKPRLLKWLNHRIMLGWSEWYAPGYYREHAEALYNLVDLCLDEEVRTKASIALDLLMFDVARLNHRGSFGAAAGRAQVHYKVSGWAQGPGDWLEFLFGTRGAFAGASALAVAAAGSEYQVPDVLLEIGTSVPTRPVFDKSRVSVHFNEEERYGIRAKEASGWATQMTEINSQIARTHQGGYGQADDDTVFWWGRGAYFNKQVINDTARLIEKYGLADTAPFDQYDKLFGLGRPVIRSARLAASGAALMAFGLPGLVLSIPLVGWPFGDEEAHADDISLLVEGSTLSRANLYTWRDRGAMLSSLQNFRPTQLNFQTSTCQATLSTEASVWSNSPFSGADVLGFEVMPAKHGDGVGWWTGNWSLPRVVQFENAAIIAYRPVGVQRDLHTNASHCWFPHAAFDDFKEGVRPANVEGDDDGTWAFGRVRHADGVEGYVGVYSAREPDYLNKNSDFYQEWMEKQVKDKIGEQDEARQDEDKKIEERQAAAREWRTLVTRWASGLVTDFFARKDLYAEDDNIWIIQVGSSDEFGSFQTFKDEVKAARIHVNFGDMQCSYDIPRRGRLELHTDIDEDEARERGWFRYRGERLATDLYQRFNSPFVRAGRVEWGQPNFALQWKGYNAWYLFDQAAEPVRILNKARSDKEAKLLRGLAMRIRTEHEEMDEDTVARATVRIGGETVVSKQVVARGEVEEHTDHDVEWLLFGPADGTQPITITLDHVPSNPSDDGEPHWRMRFELWALTADARLLPCKLELAKAANYNTRRVTHLNFEDEHRSSGEIPVAIEDL